MRIIQIHWASWQQITVELQYSNIDDSFTTTISNSFLSP